MSDEYTKREQDAWQVVCDIPGQLVRRFAVPSGWLYQVGSFVTQSGWHPPIFVPHPPVK